MRSPWVLVSALLVSLAPTAVRAQPAGSGTGSCSGGLAGVVKVDVPDGQGGFLDVPPAQTSLLFGAAECQCASTDLTFSVALTQALPAAATGTVEVWVGQDCDQYAKRMDPAGSCEQLVDGVPALTTLTTAAPSGARVRVPIPSVSLFSPRVHDCAAQPTAHNGVYLIVYSDPTAPLATCTLPLTEQTKGPPMVSDLGTLSLPDADPGLVSVSWGQLLSAETTSFDVLCGDRPGYQGGVEPDRTYSICLDGKLRRRTLTTAAGTKVNGSWTRVGNLFPDLDPSYSCGSVGPSRGSLAFLLNPGVSHEFVVLAVDAFGNGTPSTLATSVPAAPTSGTAGGSGGGGAGGGGAGGGAAGATTSTHGCSLGGAAATSPFALGLVVLALAGLIARGRRRARA